jgi:hypothetical protein
MPLTKAKSAKKSDVSKAVSKNMHELAHKVTKKRNQKQMVAIAIANAKRK